MQRRDKKAAQETKNRGSSYACSDIRDAAKTCRIETKSFRLIHAGSPGKPLCRNATWPEHLSLMKKDAQMLLLEERKGAPLADFFGGVGAIWAPQKNICAETKTGRDMQLHVTS